MQDILIKIGEALAYIIAGVLLALLARIKKQLDLSSVERERRSELEKKEKIRSEKAMNIDDAMLLDSAIDSMLNQLLAAVDASRVFVMKFHNGMEYGDGNPMLKLTVTHEAIVGGMSHAQDTISNFLFSKVSRPFMELMEGKSANAYFIPNKDLFYEEVEQRAHAVAYVSVANMKESILKNTMINLGVTGMVMTFIADVGMKRTTILCVNWSNEKYKDKTIVPSEKDLEAIFNQAQNMSYTFRKRLESMLNSGNYALDLSSPRGIKLVDKEEDCETKDK